MQPINKVVQFILFYSMYIFVMLNIIFIRFYNMEKCIPQQSCDPFLKVSVLCLKYWRE